MEKNYRKLEVFKSPEPHALEYPKLKLRETGKLDLVDSEGICFAVLAEIKNGCLVASTDCKYSLEINGIATDWAQWDEDGAIKVAKFSWRG